MNGSDNHTPRFDALAAGLALEQRAFEELAALGPGNDIEAAAAKAREVLKTFTENPDRRVHAGIFLAVVEDNQDGVPGFALAGGFVGMGGQIEALEMLIRGRRMQTMANPDGVEH